jgi:hypothetical protein
MKDLERRERLRKTIAEKRAEITSLLATPRSDSVQGLLSQASGALTGAEQIMGTSVEHFPYPGDDEDEERLFGAVDLAIQAASGLVARVTNAIAQFGPNTEVL